MNESIDKLNAQMQAHGSNWMIHMMNNMINHMSPMEYRDKPKPKRKKKKRK